MNTKIDGPRLAPLPPTPGVDPAAGRLRSSGEEKVGAIAASDSVRLTEVGSELAAAARGAGEPAPFDSAKVAAVRAALADGTHRVDAQLIADRLLAVEKDLPR
jgi:negative regulator of flagellin synthesis FlgM